MSYPEAYMYMHLYLARRQPAISTPDNPASKISDPAKQEKANTYDFGISNHAEREKANANGIVPQELLVHIFSYMQPREITNLSRVCRAWNIAHSPEADFGEFLWRDVSPKALGYHVIDAKVWGKELLETNRLDATGGPNISGRKLASALHLLSELEEEGKGVTLLTMPKGLTINILMRIIESNRVPINTRNRIVLIHLCKNLRKKISVKETYVVAISNSVLKGSRILNYNQRETLLKATGCERPSVLEITTLAVLNYLKFPKTNLLKSQTYTDCSDFADPREVFQGNSLSPYGLQIDTSPPCWFGGPYIKDVGVVGVKKF